MDLDPQSNQPLLMTSDDLRYTKPRAYAAGVTTLTDPRSSTIYDTRAYAYMLAVYPPTRPGISCSCER